MPGLHDLCVGPCYVSLETGIPPVSCYYSNSHLRLVLCEAKDWYPTCKLLLQRFPSKACRSLLRSGSVITTVGQMYPEIPRKACRPLL